MTSRFLLWLALCVALPAVAAPAELVMIAPLNQSMPYAHYEDGEITAGIIKDISEALAKRAGRRIRFVSVRGDQVSNMLREGKVDGICHVRPHWIDGDYHWSRPLIPDAELIASHFDAPVIRTIGDLRDREVGTVAGYRYPRVEQVLGMRMWRDDAPTMEENLKKMMGSGPRHTIMGRNTLHYHTKNNPALRLRSDLVFAEFISQCAFAKRGARAQVDLDRALNSLAEDGSVTNILARYR